jgi:pyruvate/2-oxoglutarate/acetoin dehydrogenase E1 component
VIYQKTAFGGIASDRLMEQCFEYLDAPVKRVAFRHPLLQKH